MDPTPLIAVECSPSHADAIALMAALSRELAQITGSDGTANFREEDAAQSAPRFCCCARVPSPWDADR